MAKAKQRKILFFVEGGMPTEEQRTEAKLANGQICWRNPFYATPEDGIEPFDEVRGDVPAHYVAHAEKLKLTTPAPKDPPRVDAGSEAAANATESKVVTPPRGTGNGAGWSNNA